MLPLTGSEIQILIKVSRLKWALIETAIFGTQAAYAPADCGCIHFAHDHSVRVNMSSTDQGGRGFGMARDKTNRNAGSNSSRSQAAEPRRIVVGPSVVVRDATRPVLVSVR